MTSALENQKSLAKQFIQHDEAWDIEASIALRTADCKNWLGGDSLGYAPMDNKGWADFLGGFKPVWEGYKIDVLSTIHDTDTHKSSIRIMAHGSSAVGPLEMGSVFELTFNEEGTKIKNMVEFVDTKALTEFLGKLGGAGAESS